LTLKSIAARLHLGTTRNAGQRLREYQTPGQPDTQAELGI
jgi:hypothetical protein